MALVVVPSIDLRDGQVVRLKQGDYAQQLSYAIDPVEIAKSFAAAGATWMHVVDLDGAKEGRPVQTSLIEQIIAASGLKVQVGGGIRTADDISTLLEAGASRVVLGTRAMEDLAWFEWQVKDENFHHKLVLAVDAKNGFVATRGWTETSGMLATDVAAKVSDWPLAALLYTDVARDGMLSGPNFEATAKLAAAGKVPVIASGGVGNLEHIRRLVTLPVWGVIVGRSLYEGAVDLKDALRVAEGRVAEGPVAEGPVADGRD
jgi:phosphoribosylformimino-5-aminoimidazole carboxamide ribotide isomerase